jgi:hypothetical protein
MATLTAYKQLTLIEVAKRKAPDGDMAEIAEVLNESNEIIQDAIWREANDTFSNKTVRRASLPTGTWRKLNEGVATESSETIEKVDTIGMLETWAQTDVEIIKAFPDPVQARNDEAMPFVEGLGQTMAAAMFYSNSSTTPEKFTGLAPRMASIAATTNVINEGGTGSDLCSIFVVDWGPGSVYMIYPKNSVAGLEHKDKGIETVRSASDNQNMYEAYVDKFVWKAGMVVKNSKNIGRIANIESTGASNTFDEDNLITLMNRMTKGPGRRIYANTTVMTQMEIRAKDKTNINYTFADGLAPGPVLMFKGVPVRHCEQLLITEAALT